MTEIGDEICWRLRRLPDGTVAAGLDPLGWTATEGPAAGEAVVRVEAAGFNYKDALCCTGHPGVMRISPLMMFSPTPTPALPSMRIDACLFIPAA